MMKFQTGVLLVFSALLSQALGKCTQEQVKTINNCRVSEFMHVMIIGERGIAGILLTNLTEAEYKLHCQLLDQYQKCIGDVSAQCHLQIQSDPVFQGVLSYYKFVCSHNYQDYVSGFQCRTVMSDIPAVQKCDTEIKDLNLHPGPDSGVCSDITSWLWCYTAAVSKNCTRERDGPTTESALYVMRAQTKLVEQLANAGKCELQEYMHYTTVDSENEPSHGRGWIHGVWISVVIVCVLIGVLAYVAYRKRNKGVIPRQRLVNEVA